MKKVFAITCLLVVLVSAMAAAQVPAQTPWKIQIKADSGSGMNSQAALILGLAATSKDGFGADGTAVEAGNIDRVFNFSTAAGSRGIGTVQGGNQAVPSSAGTLLYYDIKSARSPFDPYYAPGMAAPNGGTVTEMGKYGEYSRIWDLRVFANAGTPLSQNSDYIRLSFTTFSATTLPVSSVKNAAGNNVTAASGWLKYSIRMVDNKGLADPKFANGTTWNIPIPTVHSSTVAYFTLTLPVLQLQGGANGGAAISEGYQMQFIQSVPEPGTIAAALALLAPAGLVFRRRRV